MEGFFGFLEALAPVQALRFSRWGYAAVNTGHVLAIALLVGGSVPLALRLLGFWPAVPRAAVARLLSATAGAGLVLALLTGSLLFATRATEYAANPAFQFKIALVTLGAVSTILGRKPPWAGHGGGGRCRRAPGGGDIAGVLGRGARLRPPDRVRPGLTGRARSALGPRRARSFAFPFPVQGRMSAPHGTHDMTARIFIDGEAGTTGLQIAERLGPRGDLSLIHLDDAERKDADARKAALAEADVAILCLPDGAAREAVALADESTRIIDASTAHRTAAGWVFGYPELEAGHEAEIAGARLVANPGCYALSSIALLGPWWRPG